MAYVATFDELRHWLGSRLWSSRRVIGLRRVWLTYLHLLQLHLDLGTNLRLHFPLDPFVHLTAELLLHHLTEHIFAVAHLITHLLLEHLSQ